MSDRSSADSVAPVPESAVAPAAAPAASPLSTTITRTWGEWNACEFLTVPQHTALMSLTQGKSIRESAESAGVHRNTVLNWIHRDPVFRAAYNAWRREVNASARAKVLALAEAAATAVSNAVVKGDARIALSVLKDLGLTRPDAATRPTHPGVVRVQLQKAEERRDERIWALQHDEIFAYPSVREDLQRRLAEPSAADPDCKQDSPDGHPVARGPVDSA